MFNFFGSRAKYIGSAAASSTTTEPVYPPQIHQYQNAEEWLRAWVGFRLHEAKGAGRDGICEVNGQAMLPLLGSIGQDSAIAEDGTFWIWLEDTEIAEELNTWRIASPGERTWLIVCAQRRRFPEFSVLLPLKPIYVIACNTCSGTGFVYGNSVICTERSALGWLPDKR